MCVSSYEISQLYRILFGVFYFSRASIGYFQYILDPSSNLYFVRYCIFFIYIFQFFRSLGFSDLRIPEYSIDGFLCLWIGTLRIFEYLVRSVFSDSRIVGSHDFREMEKEVASSHSRMSQLHSSLNLRIAAFPAFAVSRGFLPFPESLPKYTQFRDESPFQPLPFYAERAWKRRFRGCSADDPSTDSRWRVFTLFSPRIRRREFPGRVSARSE